VSVSKSVLLSYLHDSSRTKLFSKNLGTILKMHSVEKSKNLLSFVAY